MMRKIVWFFVPFAVLLFSTNVFAISITPSPTITGATGLVRVPSADILPQKSYSLAFDYGTNAMAGQEVLYYKLNVGMFQNVEMGAVGGYNQTSASSSPHEGVFINAKLSLASDEGPNALRLAMGVENLTSFSQTDVYMVATKYMKQGFKLTFGFLADFPDNRFRPLGVAGVEVPFLSNHLVLLADGMAGETLSQVDAGARVYLTPDFEIHINALNIFQGSASQPAKDPKSFLAGLCWTDPF